MKMAKNGNTETPARNIISNGTKIQGDIESDGDFRIEGIVSGTVKAKGKIVIGETGQIDGQIQCQSADISGKASVKLEVTELTILRATSQFTGDIITKKISIESGAIFSGTCQMAKTAVPSQQEIKPKS
jgi:cytoskeletal protein CcmA (bactofilin family)